MDTDASQHLSKERKGGKIQGRIWAKNNKNDSLQAHQAGRGYIQSIDSGKRKIGQT